MTDFGNEDVISAVNTFAEFYTHLESNGKKVADADTLFHNLLTSCSVPEFCNSINNATELYLREHADAEAMPMLDAIPLAFARYRSLVHLGRWLPESVPGSAFYGGTYRTETAPGSLEFDLSRQNQRRDQNGVRSDVFAPPREGEGNRRLINDSTSIYCSNCARWNVEGARFAHEAHECQQPSGRGRNNNNNRRNGGGGGRGRGGRARGRGRGNGGGRQDSQHNSQAALPSNPASQARNSGHQAGRGGRGGRAPAAATQRTGSAHSVSFGPIIL
jgi:hypothetical protein